MSKARCVASTTPDRKHKWSGPVPLLEGGWGWHCVRCAVFVTSDDLFRALDTTAWDALQKLEAAWESEARCDDVANAMEKIDLGA
jgi:hypothetical protein